MRRTKIVCTIGPASEKPEMLAKLIDNGMNVARLNLSHGDYEEHGARIDTLQRMRAERGMPLGIMLDTKGPEIRLGKFTEGKVSLRAGQAFTLTSREVAGDATIASVSYAGLPADVYAGARILIDDGLIELHVDKVVGPDIHCTALNGGVISDRKGVNVPGVELNLPSVTPKDIEDLRFGIRKGIDFVAASFVRRAQDVLEIKALLAANGGSHIRVIAKIENRQGVMNIDEIVTVADGIMVGRGDLGVEIPLEDVPTAQKRIIARCNEEGKPVITATQMLDSMITRPRPTRAEVSDVANSILDGTDAIMLSGETANGAYPAEAVSVMARVAAHTEAEFGSRPASSVVHRIGSVSAAVSHACHTIAQDLGVKAIITATQSGSTAQQISRYRPSCAIFATTTSEKVYHALSLQWGVSPMLCPEVETTDELIDESVRVVLEAGLVANGDSVIITSGLPVGLSGTTNLLKVHIVGDVLAHGHGLCGGPAYGRVYVVTDVAKALAEFRPGDILVAERTTNALLPLMKQASAILVEDGDLLGHSATVSLALELPVILGLRGICTMLKDGMYVTIDPHSGCIYNGKATSLL